MLCGDRNARSRVGRHMQVTEGMSVMEVSSQTAVDGRQCCVVMAERKGRKVGTGSVGTEGMGVMGGGHTDSVGTEGNEVW